jgi:hypothetical protein
MPQNSVLNGADSGIIVFQPRFEVGARDLGDDRTKSPYLVCHSDGSDRFLNLHWITSHISFCIIQIEQYRETRRSPMDPPTLESNPPGRVVALTDR